MARQGVAWQVYSKAMVTRPKGAKRRTGTNRLVQELTPAIPALLPQGEGDPLPAQRKIFAVFNDHWFRRLDPPPWNKRE